MYRVRCHCPFVKVIYEVLRCDVTQEEAEAVVWQTHGASEVDSVELVRVRAWNDEEEDPSP